MNPRVSIIIAGRNAEETIEKCIVSLFGLEYGNKEIIVVDDGSRDGTSGILNRYLGRIRVITNGDSLGPAEARNIAAKEAAGEYVAFTDADCIVEKDWITKLAECFEKNPDAVSCGGEQDIPHDATRFEKKVFKFFRKTGFIADYARVARGDRPVPVDHNASCNAMYRKDVFLKEGGFLKGLWPGEDVELDHRLRLKGHRLFFVPGARVYHYRSRDLKSFSRMMFRYGWAQGVLARKYGFFRRIQTVPLWAAGLAALSLLILMNAPAVFFVLSGIGIYFFLAYSGFDPDIFVLATSGFIFWNLGFQRGYWEKHGIEGR